MDLSILICHDKKREVFLSRLKLSIAFAAMRSSVNVDYKYELLNSSYSIIEISPSQIAEIIIDDTPDISIGAKRNILLNKAKGKYVVFIDDDDLISSDYFVQICNGIEKEVDCCSLIGKYYENGKYIADFKHSIVNSSYSEKDGVYLRPPNHLNVIRSEIAKKFKFPEKNIGEDTDWAMMIAESKFLKTEHEVREPIYYYEKLTYEYNLANISHIDPKLGLGTRFN
jgi:glycosyltransferase involved in cell wall biosynthesis